MYFTFTYTIFKNKSLKNPLKIIFIVYVNLKYKHNIHKIQVTNI